MSRQPTFELRAREGRAVLVERTDRGGQERVPEALELPETLVQAMHEWAGVVGTLEPVDATSDSAEVLSRRGRHSSISALSRHRERDRDRRRQGKRLYS